MKDSLDFFKKIKDNYSVLLGTQKTIILFFDGKNVTSNQSINLYDLEKGSFSRSLVNTAKEFSIRWHCKALVGIDEMLFIINKPYNFIKKYRNTASDIVSITSQEIFSYFNNIYQNKNMYFHAKVFAINIDKVELFLKYQLSRWTNVLLQYYLKKNGYDTHNLKFVDMKRIVTETGIYNNLIPLFRNGLLIQNRKYYDFSKYVNGNFEEFVFSFNVQLPTNVQKVDIEDF